jgi:hypothetical protein
MPDKLTCTYCGKQREQFVLAIGASLTKDWVIWEGTGKVSCPDCWEQAKEESANAIEMHIAQNS